MAQGYTIMAVGGGLTLLPRGEPPKVAGSNPAPATIDDEGLADAAAANPFRYPGFTQELVGVRRAPALQRRAGGGGVGGAARAHASPGAPVSLEDAPLSGAPIHLQACAHPRSH